MIECTSTTPIGQPPEFPPATNDTHELGTSCVGGPRSPLSQHQEFFNAIQKRYSLTGPFATEQSKKQQQAPEIQLPSNTLHFSAASLAIKRKLALPNHSSSSISPVSLTQGLSVFEPRVVIDLLESNSPDSSTLLLIDVRSFVHYTHLHIKSAINISVPNTILKRPSFTLDKIADVIASDEHRQLWLKWRQAKHIVLYDQQGSLLQENSTISYFVQKFKTSHFDGTLAYLKGGMDAFSKIYADRCIGATPPQRRSPSGHIVPPTPSLSGLPPLTPTKRPGAFNLGPLPSMTASMPLKNHAFNPFFSNIRQNMELSHGSIKERFSVRLAPDCTVDTDTGKVAGTKRKLRDCAGLTEPTRLPPWLRKTLVPVEGPHYLAECYENIERTEQRRLQSVMAHHAKADNDLMDHPFSIVAGIEKGTLNRYTNIWPFEYTRVKLETSKPDADYINASYIQYIDCDTADVHTPTGSAQDVPKLLTLNEQMKLGRQYRRYISTQGPLPSTFGDFWSVVWQQNSRVIVMLTKQEEMNRIKCHQYWPSTVDQSETYGSVRVTLIKETVRVLSDHPDDQIIRRDFSIQFKSETRQVTQIQYTGWQDFGVPDDPLGTLALVKLADETQRSFESPGPMIVHCSAGCGRSGAFCAIDTLIHRLKDSGDIRDLEKAGELDLLYQTICKFREQRVSMVQTLRQYVFCYEAILWWILGY
ncbi:protein-tyrosine phosphatase-like protein [Radiomyces spectabilis]|uniref:protein-tyrosine phosphatase-like protein n=1 Tax=Radiomyces spectabilis TaxID=64574 RepID=UPI00221F962B|nr:protein-tyrosine phosphatase-like protein [Radiomyces spectabilis]KAI8365204.1 protein-tyrosine phosphatase-like protein [Radiomyces spectabilis]